MQLTVQYVEAHKERWPELAESYLRQRETIRKLTEQRDTGITPKMTRLEKTIESLEEENRRLVNMERVEVEVLERQLRDMDRELKRARRELQEQRAINQSIL